VFFLWHFGRLNGTLALVIALLGFVILWQVVGRISDRIVDLTGIAEGQVQQSAALPSQQSPIVPRLGPIAEIGDPALARVLGANAAPRSISTCGDVRARRQGSHAGRQACAGDGAVRDRRPLPRRR